VNSTVAGLADAEAINSKCRSLTIVDIEDSGGCSFFKKFKETEETEISGVFTIDDLKSLGIQEGWCPYYASRKFLPKADVVVFSYQYLLDARVSASAPIFGTEFARKALETNGVTPQDPAVVVFDDALQGSKWTQFASNIVRLFLPLLLYFSTQGALLFGFAKPVPVNFGNLNHPKRDMIWVALAGPASNLLQAIVWMLLFVVYTDFGVSEKFFLAMCKAGVLSNVVMFAFNLFPLPPLDGGRMVVGLLPLNWAYQFSRIEPYGFYIVMALAITGVVNNLWLDPVMSATFKFIEFILKTVT
jgi:Zn-dependent protease